MVVACYEQLIAEGYLVGSAGSGTRVAAGVREPAARSRPAGTTSPSATTRHRVEIDFEYGVPDLRSAPLPDWLWALHEAGRTAPTAVMGDERDAGALRLRQVVAAHHRRVRAGTADAEHAVIVSGFRQGLVLALAALGRSGVERVGLEDPGPREHDELVRRAGMHPVAVPVGGDGLDVDALHRSGARAVVVTPAHQWPTGVVLAPERRHALVAWAAEVDGTILEDDYDAEFRYDRQPVGSLQGLAPDRVLALGSLSKTLAPGIRLGWLLVPPALVGPVVREKLLTSRGAPALDQLALATLMESGRYDRHVRRMREVYRQRRDTLTSSMTEHAPGLRLVGLEAGCHALLELPEGVAEDEVVHSALRRASAYTACRATGSMPRGQARRTCLRPWFSVSGTSTRNGSCAASRCSGRSCRARSPRSGAAGIDASRAGRHVASPQEEPAAAHDPAVRDRRRIPVVGLP
jgi:GntR family transcriptional regulator / MocR family aminotransferase